MQRYGIGEILEKVGAEKKTANKVAILQENSNAALHIVLRFAYHPDIKFLLPEGPTPYTPHKSDMRQIGRLFHESRKLHNYVSILGVEQVPGLKPWRRELVWVQLLESLDPKDALLLDKAKDKALPWDVPYEVVVQAFPGLIPDKKPALPKVSSKKK